ncbi:hypothetical protein SteCoe_35742 [Stentor coeruleus]|uniref:Uncharacterized protein n=1 Tax=Stentor coeruleus TaxID=5963 RepID=A0A1R2ARR6_9CILI|nr:hypothetical protein SteCoe_35742 [Stentor coeruleus]
MNKNKKQSLPGFSGVVGLEQDILNRYYCYKRFFNADLSFVNPKFEFFINGNYKIPSKIGSSSSLCINNDILNTSIDFSKTGIKGVNMNFRFPKHYIGPKSSNNLISEYIQSGLRIKLYPFTSNSINLSLAYSLQNVKGKIKANRSKIVANATFGSFNLGVGGKIQYNLDNFAVKNYECIGWYKEDDTRVAAQYEITPLKPLENTFNVYFMQKIFENVNFVANLKSIPQKKTDFWIGNEASFDDFLIMKGKASNNGIVALAFWAKILPRTKMNIALKVDLKNPGNSQFGLSFNFKSNQKIKIR